MHPVLHVVPAVAPRYGGPSAAVVGLCRALEQAGVATLIATTDADGGGRLRVPLGTPTDFNGTRAIFFARHLGEAFKWSRGLTAWLRTHVRDFGLVHVHAVFSHSSIAAGRACRDAGVPYLVRPLGSLDPWSLDRKRARKTWFLRLGGRALLAGAAGIHYTTRDEQRLAEGAVPGLPRGIVVPLGVDDALFTTGRETDDSRSEDPYVLGMARLDAKKGFDVLIHAFHRVVADGALSHWRLVLAGDGEPAMVEHLKRMAHEGPGADHIEFCGWVSGAEKASLLAGASVFALPSLQENFGISVAEALAAGVPVVVSPAVNLASDIVEHTAGWVVEREPAALAPTLHLAMANADERRCRSAAGRRLAESFRWRNVGHALAGVYAELAGARV